VYSPTIYNALIEARIDELHRAVGPVAGSGAVGAAADRIRHWTEALATYFKPAVQTIPAR
jgi:hypothetical protein